MLLLIGAASGGGSCEPTPPPRPAPSSMGSPVPRVPTGERYNKVDVLTGQQVRGLEFVSSETGFALFADCGQRCRGALFVTFDGGQSWLERPLPFAWADELHMDAVDAHTVLIYTGPRSWFFSRDSGRTFTAVAELPAELIAAARDSDPDCAFGSVCQTRPLIEVEVPVGQAALPGQVRAGATAAATRQRWAASVQEGRVHVATSRDGGRSWEAVPDPPGSSPAPTSVDLEVSADGTELWLVTGGPSGIVNVWLLGDGHWFGVGEARDLGPQRTSSVALGRGYLAMAGSRFGFLSNTGYWWPKDLGGYVQRVRAAADGTVQAFGRPGEVWLGVGQGGERSWFHVVLEGE
ncbi:hypothetical protein [Virgisporangium aliadipatigenens]|uniref:hypothetical protein n=1 Tax=Virgisporangium aliadipatigenens TaxID=741659 RepID=UPI00194459EA|nr:hypothetical protein [Virgisporangium aliadipatigenens]